MTDMTYQPESLWTDDESSDPDEDADYAEPRHALVVRPDGIYDPAADRRLDSHAAAHNTVLPGLRVGRHLSIAQRYAEWRGTPDGRLVFDELRRRARGLRERGWTHYSHKAIIETIRYDRAIAVGPVAGFKINDHFSSRLARELMADYPDLAGFFEVRELRAK